MGSLIGFRVIGQIKPLLQPSFSQTGEKRCQYQDDPYFFADKYQNFHFYIHSFRFAQAQNVMKMFS